MKKYLPYIVVYLIYASFVLICISDISSSHYTQAFIGWIITIPLIVGTILYIAITIKKSPKESKKRIITSIVFPIEYSEKESPEKETPVFIEDYPLLEFAKKFGPKMQVGEFTDSEGKIFHKCRFINGNTETWISFFSQMGELTASEIAQKKHELKVGKRPNGKYFLHDANVKPWQDVDLTL